MKKISIFVIIVIVIGLGGWYYYSHNQETTMKASGTSTTSRVDDAFIQDIEGKAEFSGFKTDSKYLLSIRVQNVGFPKDSKSIIGSKVFLNI